MILGGRYMKSVLLGNGVNIQFGNIAYSSEYIVKRIIYRAKLGGYDKLFGGKITGDEIVNVFNGLAPTLNEIIDGNFDSILSEDIIPIIDDFKNRYKCKINVPHEIMLEDWLFVVHMFFLVNDDISENLRASEQGFKQLILDGIYNGGKIQELYQHIPSYARKHVKRFFSSFDNIFTLNYDNNLENLTGKNVYHLHGDFTILQNSENVENATGFIRERNNERVIIKGMEHCFCNALLSYDGNKKLKEINDNHNCIVNSENLAWKYHNDDDFKSQLEKIKEEDPYNYEIIMTKINNPYLKMATEYYFYEFENIKDELYIIGMSPNNDNHIFECINNNKNIKKVYFYYYSNYEKEIIENMKPKGLYKAINVQELWGELNFKKKKYIVTYEGLSEKIDKFIVILNEYSEDEVSKKKIVEEIKKIPQFEAIRLCKLVKENLKKRNPDNINTNRDEFNKTRQSISLIALSEGILPSVLYMLYIIYNGQI